MYSKFYYLLMIFSEVPGPSLESLRLSQASADITMITSDD